MQQSVRAVAAVVLLSSPDRVEVQALLLDADDTLTAGAIPSHRSRHAWPGPGLLAHVLKAKFCDHLPLYRESMIYAREGVELDRSTAPGRGTAPLCDVC